MALTNHSPFDIYYLFLFTYNNRGLARFLSVFVDHLDLRLTILAPPFPTLLDCASIMKTSISSDVWEKKKALISKLYMEEEWPLKQVIKQIRTDDFNPR